MISFSIIILYSFQNCKVVASFARRGSESGIDFELEGDDSNLGDGEHWIAIGFSLDGGRSMGNDAVVACYQNTVANYWNTKGPYYSLPLDVSNIVNVVIATGAGH